MDNLTKSSLNFFTSSSLDRMAGVRYKKRDFSELADSSQTRYILVKEGGNLLKNGDATKPVFLRKDELQGIIPHKNNCFLLGIKDEYTYFVLDMDLCDQIFTLKEEFEFTALRNSRLDVKIWTGSLLAYTNALVLWHKKHRFCGNCGSETLSEELGQARYCQNKDCAIPHYPRTDPAIIVVVTSGEKCLMARKSEWPESMYSVVAGYVDHGESLEDTVVREVMEETAIKVKSVHYHSSQPWPFPYTLMVGFFAEAENENITVDPHELEDARWFSREDIIRGLKEGSHKLPSPFSIARNLITDWFNLGDLGNLDDYL